MLSNWIAPRRRNFDSRDLIDDTIRDFFGEDMLTPFAATVPTSTMVSGEPNVPIDFIEKPNEYIVHADLPGLKKENIIVNIEPNNMLVISGKLTFFYHNLLIFFCP